MVGDVCTSFQLIRRSTPAMEASLKAASEKTGAALVYCWTAIRPLEGGVVAALDAGPVDERHELPDGALVVVVEPPAVPSAATGPTSATATRMTMIRWPDTVG